MNDRREAGCAAPYPQYIKRLHKSCRRRVIEEPHVGIVKSYGFRAKLQDQFYVPEMILQTSLDYFSRIWEVLRLGLVRRPLPMAKVLPGLDVSHYPPHGVMRLLISQ